MVHQKVGVRVGPFDLLERYLRSGSWFCTESPFKEKKAHYWKESKRGAESSTFTCEYCGEVRKLCNSWSGHTEAIAKKLNKSTGYIEGAMIPVQTEVLQTPTTKLDKIHHAGKRM